VKSARCCTTAGPKYVQDRPDLDLLLVSTLKPTVTDKNGSTVLIELTLLEAGGDAESDPLRRCVGPESKQS
jgi:hypothetical protein